ncbi:hypothetical protein DFJ73DRAFT_863491 [Zopfochytrium polystomum]|nr:hypothetical protein DFJ73DRAFT_863491 [Zopfochytrium polystomum]
MSSDCALLLQAWPNLASIGMTASNCCSGFGSIIACDGNDRITSIGTGYSDSNALTPELTGGGPIPQQIFQMTQLNNIWFQHSGLTGPIPTGFGSLQNLEGLHLHYNNLYGEVPDDIANLPNLNYLHLEGNQLGPNLPASWGNNPGAFKNLKTALFHTNLFVGTVPASWGNNGMKYTYLEVFGNCLSGLEDTSLNGVYCTTGCQYAGGTIISYYDPQKPANACPPNTVSSYHANCLGGYPAVCNTQNCIADNAAPASASDFAAPPGWGNVVVPTPNTVTSASTSSASSSSSSADSSSSSSASPSSSAAAKSSPSAATVAATSLPGSANSTTSSKSDSTRSAGASGYVVAGATISSLILFMSMSMF